jgi:hypothetical protein
LPRHQIAIQPTAATGITSITRRDRLHHHLHHPARSAPPSPPSPGAIGSTITSITRRDRLHHHLHHPARSPPSAARAAAVSDRPNWHNDPAFDFVSSFVRVYFFQKSALYPPRGAGFQRRKTCFLGFYSLSKLIGQIRSTGTITGFYPLFLL